MPEFFEISLILDTKHYSRDIAKKISNKLHIFEGSNNIPHSIYSLLTSKEVIFSVYTLDDKNFDLISIDIGDLIFHQSTFKDELAQLTQLVNTCFQLSPHIAYALCGYETNLHKIERIANLRDIDTVFLSQFPIAYIRNPNSMPQISVNLQAQDIFTLYPCQPE